jgi:SAM-dependent methyltransferase
MSPPASRSAYRLRDRCRTCDGRALHEFLDLGAQPLANAFLRSPGEAATESRYPLRLFRCAECGLVQLLDVIDPETLFRNYIYVTGTSETIAAHNQAYAATVVDLLGLDRRHLVVEAASNDGSLLACFQALGVGVLGVEPAANIAQLAQARGIPTEPVFFDQARGSALRDSHGPAQAFIANNVLAHVDDPRGFLSGVHALLAEGGMAILEVPYLGELFERLEYDTVYHEHLCYLSIAALLRLCEAAGLAVARIDRVAVHGGSLRVYANRLEDRAGHALEVNDLAEAERASGAVSEERCRGFAALVRAQRDALRSLLGDLRAAGKTIAGYGAPAKGNTLLNYCGIGTDLLPFTVDRNPMKVGTLTPGTHIPVLPTETVLTRQPDFLLLLAWNFAAEIGQQQEEYRRRGGRFILPLPVPRILADPQ